MIRFSVMVVGVSDFCNRVILQLEPYVTAGSGKDSGDKDRSSGMAVTATVNASVVSLLCGEVGHA